MWGNAIKRLHYSNLRSIWTCAIMLLSLVLTGVIFIHYHPYVYSMLSEEHKSLLYMADIVVMTGFTILIVEMKNRCEMKKKKRELENVKKVRHEYRRHIQNVQALLYIEAYDEVSEYAKSIEDELRTI